MNLALFDLQKKLTSSISIDFYSIGPMDYLWRYSWKNHKVVSEEKSEATESSTKTSHKLIRKSMGTSTPCYSALSRKTFHYVWYAVMLRIMMQLNFLHYQRTRRDSCWWAILLLGLNGKISTWHTFCSFEKTHHITVKFDGLSWKCYFLCQNGLKPLNVLWNQIKSGWWSVSNVGVLPNFSMTIMHHKQDTTYNPVEPATL